MHSTGLDAEPKPWILNANKFIEQLFVNGHIFFFKYWYYPEQMFIKWIWMVYLMILIHILGFDYETKPLISDTVKCFWSRCPLLSYIINDY